MPYERRKSPLEHYGSKGKKNVGDLMINIEQPLCTKKIAFWVKLQDNIADAVA